MGELVARFATAHLKLSIANLMKQLFHRPESNQACPAALLNASYYDISQFIVSWQGISLKRP